MISSPSLTSTSSKIFLDRPAETLPVPASEGFVFKDLSFSTDVEPAAAAPRFSVPSGFPLLSFPPIASNLP